MSSTLKNFMRAQSLKERMHRAIDIYESLAGAKIPESHKNTVVKYMNHKIDHHITKGDITGAMLAIATIALIKLRIRGGK